MIWASSAVRDTGTMREESGVGNLQTLKINSRATSKYKVLEPTKLADLIRYHPRQYSEPNADELDNLGEGDLVKIVFVNNEELWIVVDSPLDGDHAQGIVYGKTTQQTMRLHGLQKGQRVCFDVKCVAQISYHSDDDDDDE